MNKKGVGIALFIFFCLGILAFSYNSWKQKLAGESRDSALAEGPMSEIAMMEDGSIASSEIESSTTEESTELTASDLASLSANMDKALAGLLVDRFESDKTVKFLIVGSQAIAQGGDKGAAGILADNLTEAYRGFIETEVIAFEGTSLEFTDRMDELVDWETGYDVLLLEPFTLNNNGRVVIEDEHRHVLRIQERLQEISDDAMLVVMPSQPIHRPSFYATQIRSLQRFTETRDIPYIDHWQGWPDVADADVLEYLDENSAPNDAGAEVWAGVLREYFMGDY